MSPYKVIIAPDSFKESMSERKLLLLLKKDSKRCSIQYIYDIIPMADGGEGTPKY